MRRAMKGKGFGSPLSGLGFMATVTLPVTYPLIPLLEGTSDRSATDRNR
jgi:hypothetical protein